MKLHALNEKITDFGFPLEIEDKDEDFHGHSRGILFAITDTSGQVLENHMPNDDNPEGDLKRLIDDNRVTKLDRMFFHLDKSGVAEEHVAHYVPYYVAGHSMLQPTLNYDNIIDDGAHVNYVDLEVIFTHCGWNRYATIHISTIDTPVISALYESFNDPSCDEFLESFGVKIDTNGGPKYMLDFYNEIGECEKVWFETPQAIRDKIVSFRVIGLKWKINKDDN